MSTLLHIDSSPLYGRSVSRELTAAFVTQWRAAHPDGKVIDRDLNATAMPPINAEWVGAVYTPEQARTPQQKELLSLSDSLLAELEQADEYVIGVPMHNFGVPSVLKLWIDQIARVGRTFAYSEKGPKGLITGKKATFIIATGGIYDAQTRLACCCCAIALTYLGIARCYAFLPFVAHRNVSFWMSRSRGLGRPLDR